MLIHGKINDSTANGPGNRAVLWMQGCSLGCPGCWNPQSHAFDLKKETSLTEIYDWINGLTGIEGITFSGGEPMQQAPYLYALTAWIKEHHPELSIGMFTGYSNKELSEGHFKWKSAYDAEWQRGSIPLWNAIKATLDFVVAGRYVERMACHDEPLRGSRNQEVMFLTSRYSEKDLSPQTTEVTIGVDGMIQITGFPTEEFLAGKSISKPVLAGISEHDEEEDSGELTTA